LRLAVEAGRLAVWEYDVATEALKPTPELNELLGFPRDEPLDLMAVRTRYLPSDRDKVRQAAQEAVDRGESFFQTEYQFQRGDGVWRWLMLRGEIRFADGKPAGVIGVVLDITERKHAEQALQESEARLEIATEASEIGIWDWDVRTDEMIYSPRARAIYGFPHDGPNTFEMVRYATHPEDLPRTSAMARRALDPAIREKKPYEYRIVRPDGTVRWVLAHGASVFGLEEGEMRARRYVGTILDITDRKRTEEHLHLLIHELNHRVKNTLATVQSIAAQSFRDVGAPAAAARTAFEDRLFALARAHDVLTRESWEGAGLKEVVGEAVAPHRGSPAGGDRFELDGPDLRLPTAMALSLSMALHELCTNAAKYGALSRPGGEVRISWTVASTEDPPRLRMRWEEHGGPPVAPPHRQGFGTRLIARGLASELSGEVSLSYEPGGVVCLIDVPVRPPF
jgi:PAS domain S-box-containing protein